VYEWQLCRKPVDYLLSFGVNLDFDLQNRAKSRIAVLWPRAQEKCY
jgi:hypothetical protein